MVLQRLVRKSEESEILNKGEDQGRKEACAAVMTAFSLAQAEGDERVADAMALLFGTTTATYMNRDLMRHHVANYQRQ